MFKIAFLKVFDNFNANLRKNKVFLTSIPNPEYGQSNAPFMGSFYKVAAEKGPEVLFSPIWML